MLKSSPGSPPVAFSGIPLPVCDKPGPDKPPQRNPNFRDQWQGPQYPSRHPCSLLIASGCKSLIDHSSRETAGNHSTVLLLRTRNIGIQLRISESLLFSTSTLLSKFYMLRFIILTPHSWFQLLKPPLTPKSVPEINHSIEME